MASIRYIAYDTGKSRGAADRAPSDGRLPLPCRGPRGYCRRGRSPLRTTVKRCSLTFIDRSRNVGFIAYSESAGEIRTSPSTLRYLSAKPQIADIQIPILVDRNLVLPALTELPVESVRHNLEPLSTTAFPTKEPQVEPLWHSSVVGRLFLPILFLSYLSAIVALPQR